MHLPCRSVIQGPPPLFPQTKPRDSKIYTQKTISPVSSSCNQQTDEVPSSVTAQLKSNRHDIQPIPAQPDVSDQAATALSGEFASQRSSPAREPALDGASGKAADRTRHPSSCYRPVSPPALPPAAMTAPLTLQQIGFRRLATFWLDNLPPINLWSLQELRANPFAAPYRLSPQPLTEPKR